MSYGCPYNKMNMQTLNEECAANRNKVIDDRDTEQGIICIFDYETRCPYYQKAKMKERKGKQMSLFEVAK